MVSNIFQIVVEIIRVIGLFFIFQKCNINKYWAFVPVANNLKLAQCADEEDAGAVWCISDFLYSAFFVISSNLIKSNHSDSTYFSIMIIITLVLAIINLIYSVRIALGLCRVFGKKKIWIPCFILFESVFIFIWGIRKEFQPQIVLNKESVGESGKTAEKLSEGLTININERTTRNGLSKKVLLKDIHMNIKPGKMVLLLGGSGAGKTTFINAITGYEKADASIMLNGNDVYHEYTKVIYDIGVVPQQELIRNTDTVFRTLMDSASLRMPSYVTKKERAKRVNEVMDIFGLTPVKNNLISKQSGGQKKRISIATEYISDPSLFILDEPDSGLDGILAKELMKKLHEISREGKIVIVVTHTPDRVIDLFDEVIVLAKDDNRTGRLIFEGPVEEAKKFFEVNSMEEIVLTINRKEEGGLGRADELLAKFNNMEEKVINHE